jgi:release factor glutamine methyltransferase
VKTETLLKQAQLTLEAANERFGYQGDEEEQAWNLFAHAGGSELGEEDEVPAALQRRFKRLIKRRITGEPLEYITGRADFLDFHLDIKPGTFVPRLTSEFLAQQAIRRLRRRRDPVHVDLATGIGPVAIASALAVPHATVWGLDISKKALGQARANARRLGAANATFRRSDLFAALPGRLRGGVDVVTIHPPYVARGELGDLPAEIRKFEPRTTLTDGSPDGLGLVRRVISEGREWIKPGGWMLIEIIPSEFRSIRPLLRQAGYSDVRSTKGPLKHTRVIVGRVQGK